MDKEKVFRLIYGMIRNSRSLYNFDNRIFTHHDWYFNRGQSNTVLQILIDEQYIIEMTDRHNRHQKVYQVTRKFCEEVKLLIDKDLTPPVPKTKKLILKEHKKVVKENNIKVTREYNSIKRLEKKIQNQKDLIVKYAISPRYAIDREKLTKIAVSRIRELEKLKKEMEVERMEEMIKNTDFSQDILIQED